MGFSPIRLVDPDVLEVENLIRHPLGAGALGQPKASALAKKICADLPVCEAVGLDADFVELSDLDQLHLALAADVVVAATDSIRCQRLVNAVALVTEKPAVYPAVWVDPRMRDAEVGEILWVLPGGHTPCYECSVTFRRGAPDADAARGARADIAQVSLATASVVAALLDPSDERSAILDPERTAIYIHGLTPTSPGIRGIFPTGGLQSQSVRVPFPPDPCPACGGHEPIAEATVAEVLEPMPPSSDASSKGRFDRLSVTALLSTMAILIVWIFGSMAYSGGRDEGADLLRALLGLAVFIGGGIGIVRWLVRLPGAIRARRRERSARSGQPEHPQTV